MNKKRGNRVRTAVYLNPEVLQLLDAISDVFCVSRNTLIEMSISEFLANSIMSTKKDEFAKILRKFKETGEVPYAV